MIRTPDAYANLRRCAPTAQHPAIIGIGRCVLSGQNYAGWAEKPILAIPFMARYVRLLRYRVGCAESARRRHTL